MDAMAKVMQQPMDPSDLARLAGKDIYGSTVGMLRRTELWRLGNAWGLNFPAGASKDYMIPFFQRLEAEGKNPLRPPGGQNLDTLVKERVVLHSEENHSEMADPVSLEPPVSAAAEKPESNEFALKLERLPQAQLKKIAKLRGVEQSRNDTKQSLIAKIIATSTSGL